MFEIKITDQISTQFTVLTMSLYNCEPRNLVFLPNSISVSILGPSMSTIWSKDPTHTTCGSYSATFTSTTNFNFSASGTSLVVSSPSTAIIGNYSSLITVTRNDDITQKTTASLAISVTRCLVTALSFDLAPVSKEIRVGIDVQPLLIPFSTTQSPACANQVIFGLSPSTSFSSVQTTTFNSGNVAVNGALSSNHDSYSMTLTASVDGTQSVPQSFTIKITDPCSYSKFVTAPAPLATMQVLVASTQTYTQTVKILTDIE